MTKNKVILNFNTIDDKKLLTYNMKKFNNNMSKVFKDFFSNSAKSFLDKPPDPSYKYNLESVFLYYSNFAIPELFHIKSTSEEIMENIEISKTSGITKLPEKFLKDGAKILSKSISEICNLSMSHGIFPNACKIVKLKAIFKKGKKVDPSNYRPISLLPLIPKIIEKVVPGQKNEFSLSQQDII